MDGVITRVSCIRVLFVDTSSTLLSYLSLVLVHSQKLQNALWLTGLCCVSTALYPLTSSVVWGTDGYFLLRHFISISVTLQIGEQERRKVGETQSVLQFPRHMVVVKKKVYTVSIMIISTLYTTQIIHTTVWLEHELSWPEKAGYYLCQPVHDSQSQQSSILQHRIFQ